MNQFTIVGRIAEKPIIKESASGNRYCQLLVEEERPYRNASGDYDKDVYSITLWKGLTEENFKEGDLIGIRGRLQSSNFEKDGTIYYRVDFIAEKLTFIEVS